MKITDFQARVAKSLVSGPKSIDEIAGDIGESKEKVDEALRSLVEYGLVRKSGERFRLIEAVRRGLESKDKLNPEEYRFRVYAIFEGISESKSALENAQSDLINKFKSDSRFEVLDINEEEILEQEGVYTSMFEAEVIAKSFHDLVYMILTYGPSSIELIEPSRFELKASEGQAILVDVAEAVHIYAQLIADLNKKLSMAGRKPSIQLKVNKGGD